MPGIGIATEPVASTIAFASWVSLPTLTLPPPASDALAGEEVDLVLLPEHLDAVGERLRDLRAALLDRLPVDRDAAGLDAQLGALLGDLGEDLGGVEHGLGRDAGVVEAAAAGLVALDHGGLLAELGGADRGDVAAGAASDHDHVVAGHRRFDSIGAGSSTVSRIPSSSVIRQTSRRSSSTSTQLPAAAGKTTWSPGAHRHRGSPAASHQSTPLPTARTIPCWGGFSCAPSGTTRPELPHPVRLQLLDHHVVEQRLQRVAGHAQRSSGRRAVSGIWIRAIARIMK